MQTRFFLFLLFLTIVFFTTVPGSFSQTWYPLGPKTSPDIINAKDYSLKFANGIGRVAKVTALPGKGKAGKPSDLFLCTPYGGLWKLVNGDTVWSSENTSGLMHIGIADLVINPKNNQVRYISTGDPDCIMDPNGPALSSEFCQSRGIVKSIDGGKTWSDTAIGNWYNADGSLNKEFWKWPSKKVARRLLIDPKCPKRLIAIIHTYSYQSQTYDGMLYQSIDDGRNWHLKLSAKDGFLKDLSYKPRSSKVVYAAGRGIYKSFDGGNNWTHLIHSGLPPDSIVKRIELSCAPSSPSTIYALVIYENARNSDIYLSEDDGKTFHKIVSALASPEWRTAMAVDPKNKNLVFFSAGNRVHRLFKTNDGWRQEYTGGFIHDDVHDLDFPFGDSNLFAGTDGGVFSSCDSGKTWRDLNDGLNIAQCWSVAVSQTGPVSVLSGLQDCGTILYKSFPDSSKGWWTVRGGDGMAAAIDHEDEQLLYANDGNNLLIARSIDGGTSWSRNLLPTRLEKAVYQRPFIIDPARKGVIFTGLQNVYKSIDYGDSWMKISNFTNPPPSDRIITLALNSLDTNFIVAGFINPVWSNEPLNRLFKTVDGGMNWIDITKGLTAVCWTNISCVVVEPGNTDIIYVGFKGGGSYKVMRTVDGGITWKNFSVGIEFDCDVNALIIDNDEPSTIYAATHHGVFRRNTNDDKWKRLGVGLPRVVVSGLDIRFENKTLFAGTHGMGVWYIKLDE